MQIRRLVLLILFGALVASGCTSTTPAHNSRDDDLVELTNCTDGTTRNGFLTSTTSGDTPCVQDMFVWELEWVRSVSKLHLTLDNFAFIALRQVGKMVERNPGSLCLANRNWFTFLCLDFNSIL